MFRVPQNPRVLPSYRKRPLPRWLPSSTYHYGIKLKSKSSHVDARKEKLNNKMRLSRASMPSDQMSDCCECDVHGGGGGRRTRENPPCCLLMRLRIAHSKEVCLKWQVDTDTSLDTSLKSPNNRKQTVNMAEKRKAKKKRDVRIFNMFGQFHSFCTYRLDRIVGIHPYNFNLMLWANWNVHFQPVV
jgi:hypothetical protein